MTKFLTATAAISVASAILVASLLVARPAQAVTAIRSEQAPSGPTVSQTPTIIVTGADADDRRRLDEAVQRFADQRLELPDLDVFFHDDERECSGHEGLFQSRHTPWRILICSDLEFVPTHELAHAWEAANLSDDERARYLETRGLAGWNDASLQWIERGVEDAAFNLQQNLTATYVTLTSDIWQERVAAYELLTGQISPLLTNR